jgi:dienelactone hydrolase
VDRGLDYLEARGDIDMSRVGVMGNSGGGTTSIYSAALLDRIQFVMPSCSFCTYEDSIMRIEHCACNYIPNLLRWAEHADVLGLFAPKPLVIVAGKEDNIFPIEGTRKAFAQLQHIYEAAGRKENCELVEGDGGHRFYERDAWPRLLRMLNR